MLHRALAHLQPFRHFYHREQFFHDLPSADLYRMLLSTMHMRITILYRVIWTLSSLYEHVTIDFYRTSACESCGSQRNAKSSSIVRQM
jgi:hypothetical protein